MSPAHWSFWGRGENLSDLRQVSNFGSPPECAQQSLTNDFNSTEFALVPCEQVNKLKIFLFWSSSIFYLKQQCNFVFVRSDGSQVHSLYLIRALHQKG